MGSPDTPPGDGQAVARLIGCWFRWAATLEAAEFRQRALSSLAQLLPFDAALWAMGASEMAGLRDALTIALPPDFMVKLKSLRPHHPLVNRACGCATAQDKGSSLFGVHGECRGARGFHAEQAYTSSAYASTEEAGILTSLCLFRRSESYAEAEAQLLTFLARNLAQAAVLSFFLHLRDQRGLDRRKRAAIVSPDGLILEAQSQFKDWLEAAFPDFDGRRVPFKIRGGWAKHRLIAEQLLAQVEPFEKLYRVWIWSASEIDSLTPRERNVTEGALMGLTAKEIAAQIQVRPSTVENRLYSAFRKLAVSNRPELRSKYADLVGCAV